MTWWAIRDKTTGLFFPKGKSGKNISYLEFHKELPPRLFKRKQDALYTARWWCDGHTWNRAKWSEYDSFDWQTKKVEGRSIDNLEIVEVKLEVVT